MAEETDSQRSELRDMNRVLELLNQVGMTLSSDLDLQSIVQKVTDAATELSGAAFGAFFYTLTNDEGKAFTLYTLSGAPRSAFERFPHPRSTDVFAPTFEGHGVIRVADIKKDPRYGNWAPYHGMPPGHLPVCSYLAVPVRLRSGEVIGGLFFGHPDCDIFTERSEAIVTGIAAQASIAIENARMFESMKRLADAERAARSEVERVSLMKDEFLATLSHELRTPLNAVLGWSQMLLGRLGEDADARRGLETIERNARAQAQLIDDLLDMNRIVSGKIRLDVQRVVVATVVEAALDTIRPSADARDLRIRTTLDSDLVVYGDPHRLQQVVWNLLSNAVKFTPKQGRIDIVLRRVSSHVELTITDSGTGIKADFLPHVFERFRQADSSTTRRHRGLGLGLSIVKQLVELHGGSVIADSAGEDRGSTFTVNLPVRALRETDSGSMAPQDGSSDRPQSMQVDLAGTTILVVDDEPDARELVKSLLVESRATVVMAGSADEALATLRAGRFDLIVSDIGMPVRDGYQFLSAVRALPDAEGGKTPAIALTAFARSEDRTRALIAGYQVHLAKPMEPRELVVTVASLLGRMRPTP